MSKNIYITTTLPYVNSDPHVGFAMEIIRADVLARYHGLIGNNVFLNTGTDEHGTKIWEKAQAEGIDVQKYVDSYAEKFKGLSDLLNLSSDIHFIRTTDESHVKAAQEFWKIVDQNGYIYKAPYEAKYCVGCELEKTDSELVDGRCPIHPDKDLELISEENYFFKFSDFTQPLLDFYEQNKNFVLPDFRFNEIKKFVERGLRDFPISRVKEKMPWGVPVPGDEDQVMYVWFDALVNYISTLGWPNGEDFKNFWEEGFTLQIAGKDNLRQQSAMWQAMLMAANIKNTDKVVINGFLNGPDGKKMSKSLGNVINPYDVVKELGADAVRFYLTYNVSSFEDSPISVEMIKESFNANLANGIGNLTNRVVKMAENYDVVVKLPEPKDVWFDKEHVGQEYHEAFKNFEPQKALEYLMNEVREMDLFIATEQPFKKVKVDELSAKEDVARLMLNLFYMGVLLEPFMPETSAKVVEAVGTRTTPKEPIFKRLD
ncbi:MAG: methionine--tRNA ligase [Candidatus Paceibacterota bacterium]